MFRFVGDPPAAFRLTPTAGQQTTLWVPRRLLISPTPDRLIPTEIARPGQVRILRRWAVLPRLHLTSCPAPNQENFCSRRRPSTIPWQGSPRRRFPPPRGRRPIKTPAPVYARQRLRPKAARF